MNKIIISILVFKSLILGNVFASLLESGSVPPKLVLENENGGLVTNGPWDSTSLKGKVHVLFYVDPDESDVNKDLEKALDEANFSKEKYQSVAVINMKATWLPNYAITKKLESKQSKFPDVIYVKDLTKFLVKAWGIKDDSYSVVALDGEGKIFFLKDGVIGKNEIQVFVDKIRVEISKVQ